MRLEGDNMDGGSLPMWVEPQPCKLVDEPPDADEEPEAALEPEAEPAAEPEAPREDQPQEPAELQE